MTKSRKETLEETDKIIDSLNDTSEIEENVKQIIKDLNLNSECVNSDVGIGKYAYSKEQAKIKGYDLVEIRTAEDLHKYNIDLNDSLQKANDLLFQNKETKSKK